MENPFAIDRTLSGLVVSNGISTCRVWQANGDKVEISIVGEVVGKKYVVNFWKLRFLQPTDEQRIINLNLDILETKKEIESKRADIRSYEKQIAIEKKRNEKKVARAKVLMARGMCHEAIIAQIKHEFKN